MVSASALVASVVSALVASVVAPDVSDSMAVSDSVEASDASDVLVSEVTTSAPLEVEVEMQVWDSGSHSVLGAVVQWAGSVQSHSQSLSEEQKGWG